MRLWKYFLSRKVRWKQVPQYPQYPQVPQIVPEIQMEVADLIEAFAVRGIGLHVRGDQLEVKFPDGLLDDEDVATLRDNKPAIIAHLANAGGSAALQTDATLAEPPAIHCLALHVQPERWVHRGGKAYCPRCRQFKGYLHAQQ